MAAKVSNFIENIKTEEGTKNPLSQSINDRINDRLKFAMSEDPLSSNLKENVQASNLNEGKESTSFGIFNDNPDEIITTWKELEGYYIMPKMKKGSYWRLELEIYNYAKELCRKIEKYVNNYENNK